MFIEVLTTNFFLQMALIAALLASIMSGIIGSYIVSRRIVFITGSIAHAVLGGIGLFVYLHFLTKSAFFSPFLGGIFSAFIFGGIIGLVYLKFHQREDSIIAAIWSIGMALGVIFIAITPGSNAELMNFLFGNILWASALELKILLVFDVIVILLSLLLHKKFVAIAFDEVECKIQKVSVYSLFFLLLTLVCLTVVFLVQVVGAILVISMLCLPAAISNLFTRSLSRMIGMAIVLSILFSILGIYVSYFFNWPPGATIALISTLFYFLSLPVKRRFV